MDIHDQLIGSFIKYLRQFVTLSDDEIKKYLIPVIKKREFSKKQLITKAGEVENYINFISKGVVRKYYLHNDQENVVQISIEGHLVSSQESLYTRTPSEYFVETIEPSVLVSITYDDLEKIFSLSHKLERLGRLVAIHTMVLIDKWQLSLIRQTPRERFLHFVRNHPEIIQRVPQKFLASYLNIKPETFSRFKHLIRSYKPSQLSNI